MAQVTWSISFRSAYRGTKNLYLYVKDQSGLTEGNVKTLVSVSRDTRVARAQIRGGSYYG
jgi:hypothetical protein